MNQISVIILAITTGTLVGACLFLVWLYRQEKIKNAVQNEMLEALQVDKQNMIAELQKQHISAAGMTSEIEQHKNNQQLHNTLLQQQRENMKQDFLQMSNKLFEEKSRSFSESNQMLLQPLREQLASFRQRIDQIHSDDTKSQSSLLQEIKNLRELNNQMSKEALSLTSALKGTGSAKVQGDWGEMILERLLEESGLVKGREYDIQKGYRNEEGSLYKPDIIIHLPDKKDVVIDVKVSLNAYSRYYQTDDEQEKALQLEQHVRAIEQHVQTLSSKNYSDLHGITSLDIVLMFIPIEGAYILAIQHRPDLFEQAFRKRIAIISPSTLPSTLKIINYLWQTEYQNTNAHDITKRAAGLYDKFRGLIEDMEKLDKQLESVRQVFEGARNKLYLGRGNLVRQVESFRKDGVPVKKALDSSIVNRATDTAENNELEHK